MVTRHESNREAARTIGWDLCDESSKVAQYDAAGIYRVSHQSTEMYGIVGEEKREGPSGRSESL